MDQSWEYINRIQTHECGNWADAPQFPEKEYINWISFAVQVEAFATIVGGGGDGACSDDRKKCCFCTYSFSQIIGAQV